MSFEEDNPFAAFLGETVNTADEQPARTHPSESHSTEANAALSANIFDDNEFAQFLTLSHQGESGSVDVLGPPTETNPLDQMQSGVDERQSVQFASTPPSISSTLALGLDLRSLGLDRMTDVAESMLGATHDDSARLGTSTGHQSGHEELRGLESVLVSAAKNALINAIVMSGQSHSKHSGAEKQAVQPHDVQPTPHQHPDKHGAASREADVSKPALVYQDIQLSDLLRLAIPYLTAPSTDPTVAFLTSRTSARLLDSAVSSSRDESNDLDEDLHETVAQPIQVDSKFEYGSQDTLACTRSSPSPMISPCVTPHANVSSLMFTEAFKILRERLDMGRAGPMKSNGDNIQSTDKIIHDLNSLPPTATALASYLVELSRTLSLPGTAATSRCEEHLKAQNVASLLLAELFALNHAVWIQTEPPTLTPKTTQSMGSASSIAIDSVTNEKQSHSQYDAIVDLAAAIYSSTLEALLGSSRGGLDEHKVRLLKALYYKLVGSASKLNLSPSTRLPSSRDEMRTKAMLDEYLFAFQTPSPDDLSISRIRSDRVKLGSGDKSVWLPTKTTQGAVDPTTKKALRATRRFQKAATDLLLRGSQKTRHRIEWEDEELSSEDPSHPFWTTIREYGIQSHLDLTVPRFHLSARYGSFASPKISMSSILGVILDALSAERKLSTRADDQHRRIEHAISVLERVRYNACRAYSLVHAICVHETEGLERASTPKKKPSRVTTKPLISNLITLYDESKDNQLPSEHVLISPPQLRVAVVGASRSGKTSLVGAMVYLSQQLTRYAALQEETANSGGPLKSGGQGSSGSPEVDSKEIYNVGISSDAISGFDRAPRSELTTKLAEELPLLPSLLFGRQAFCSLTLSTVWFPQAHATLTPWPAEVQTHSTIRLSLTRLIAVLQSDVALLTHMSGKPLPQNSEDYNKLESELVLHRLLGTPSLVIAITAADRQNYSQQSYMNTRATLSALLRSTGYTSDSFSGPVVLSSVDDPLPELTRVGDTNFAPLALEAPRYSGAISGPAIFIPTSSLDFANLLAPVPRSYAASVESPIQSLVRASEATKASAETMYSAVVKALPFPPPPPGIIPRKSESLEDWYRGPCLGELLDLMRSPSPSFPSCWRAELAHSVPLLLAISYIEPLFGADDIGATSDEGRPHYIARVRVIQGVLTDQSDMMTPLVVIPPVSAVAYDRHYVPFTALVSRPRYRDAEVDSRRFGWNRMDGTSPIDKRTSRHFSACLDAYQRACALPTRPSKQSGVSTQCFTPGDDLYVDIVVTQVPQAIVDIVNSTSLGSVSAPSIPPGSRVPPFSLHPGDLLMSPLPRTISEAAKSEVPSPSVQTTIIPRFISRIHPGLPIIQCKEAHIAMFILRPGPMDRFLPQRHRLVSCLHAATNDRDTLNPIQTLLFGETPAQQPYPPFSHFIYRSSSTPPLHPFDALSLETHSVHSQLHHWISLLRARSSVFRVRNVSQLNLKTLKTQALPTRVHEDQADDRIWSREDLIRLSSTPLVTHVQFDETADCFPWLFPSPEIGAPGAAGAKALSTVLWVDDAQLDAILERAQSLQIGQDGGTLMDILEPCIFAVGRVLYVSSVSEKGSE